MTPQFDSDHAAPFRDRYPESSGERVLRVAGIGRAKLLDWYSRTRNYTYPDTYGDSGCGFAFSVAYRLMHGDNRTIDKLTAYDYDVLRAVDLLNLEG